MVGPKLVPSPLTSAVSMVSHLKYGRVAVGIFYADFQSQDTIEGDHISVVGLRVDVVGVALGPGFGISRNHENHGGTIGGGGGG